MSAKNRAVVSRSFQESTFVRTFFRLTNCLPATLPLRHMIGTRIITERTRCAIKRIFVLILRTAGKFLFREIRPNPTLA
tara:strand:- start:76 stop:312 length:237 start_codon:yes stop_codon:yes gene_type:complete